MTAFRFFLVVLLLLAALPFRSAEAHFTQGSKLRTLIVTEEAGGLVVYLRAPAPLFFADVVRSARVSRQPLGSDLLYLDQAAAVPRYRISLTALDEKAEEFRTRLGNGLMWQQNGRKLDVRLLRSRVVGRTPREAFASAEEARLSLEGQSARIDPVFGEAVIEAAFALEAPIVDGDLSLAAGYPELPLPDGVTIDNHILDARGECPLSYSIPGQLIETVVLDGSWVSSVTAFVWQGVLHILKGLDHVVLVICLALGAGASVRLIWLVTAFTLGHSLTLVAAFLGFVPSWSWFIPAVEAAIAASVLYACFAAFRKTLGTPWVIAAIGLLHGFGFSFVLSDILGRSAPDLILSLAAFNLGIELGQILVLLATLAVLALLSRVSDRAVLQVRATTLAVIALVAGYWLLERSLTLV